MGTARAADLVENVRQLGKRLGFWKYGFDYDSHCRQVFGDEDLRGKTILEIGCGKGIFCLWAKIHGAKHVVGLEPLADGSFDSAQCFKDFETIVTTLHLRDIEMLPSTIQDYKWRNNYFDIVLSVASINHLDEQSCAQLHRSAQARQAYLSIFNLLRATIKDNGRFIVLDVSNRNFFGDLGVRNPFHHRIEWVKHQPPERWVELLSQCQFKDARVSWPSGRRLRYLGLDSTGRTLSYFLSSVFRLEMRCDKGP